MNRTLWLVLSLAACGPEQVAEFTPPASPPKVEEPPVSAQTGSPAGFPCDVQEVLQASCAGCHLGGWSYVVFETRDDLLPHRDRLLPRLSADAPSPMPPANAPTQLTAAQRALVERWLQSGMPAGDCGPLQP